MFAALAKSVFGSANDRYVRSLGKIVDAVNGFEPAISALSDDSLRHQTVLFRQRLAEGATLDDLLPEAFATVREAAKRTLGQRHYDVQIIGGIALHRGEIGGLVPPHTRGRAHGPRSRRPAPRAGPPSPGNPRPINPDRIFNQMRAAQPTFFALNRSDGAWGVDTLDNG